MRTASTSSDSSVPQLVMHEHREAMESHVAELFPVGANVDNVRRTLEANGFVCRRKLTARGGNQGWRLIARKERKWGFGCKTVWSIVIDYADNRILTIETNVFNVGL